MFLAKEQRGGGKEGIVSRARLRVHAHANLGVVRQGSACNRRGLLSIIFRKSLFRSKLKTLFLNLFYFYHSQIITCDQIQNTYCCAICPTRPRRQQDSGVLCSCADAVERPSRRVESFGQYQNFYGTIKNSLF